MTDIIITPDTNKKEIGCNFKNCSRISFCIMQRSRPQKFSFGSASPIKSTIFYLLSPLCVYFYESSSAFLSALRLSARQFADPVRNLRVYALASDIHLSIAFLAAFFVLESLDGNTIKIILEDDRSCDCALRCIDELPHRTEPLGIHIQNLAGVRLQNRKGFR